LRLRLKNMAERLSEEQIKDLANQLGDRAMDYAMYKSGGGSDERILGSIGILETVRNALLVAVGEKESLDMMLPVIGEDQKVELQATSFRPRIMEGK